MPLGRKAAMGGTWLIGARLLSRIIDLGTMLVLAHILHPKDFGLVAIAMSVIYVVEAALELPVSGALVRLQIVEPQHYDTAFTLSLLRGLLLGTIVCAGSWPFAHFYSDMRLFPLVCALAIAPAARGLVSPRLADFSRTLQFAPDFSMEMVGKVAAFTVAVILAVTTRSYWALAAGTVIAPVMATATSYLIAPYKPRLSLSAMSDFSGFLGWNTAAQTIGAFNWQTDRLMLAKLMSKTELGFFSTANDLATIPVMAFIAPIQRPLLSAFSLLKKEPARLAQSYQKSATAIVTLGLPILIGESLVAHQAVRLMFGSQWLGAAMPLRWLAISLLPSLFAMPVPPLVMAFGQTQLFFKRNLLEVCIKVPLVVVGAITHGFLGVIIARYISESITVLYSTFIVRKLVGLPIHRQLLGPWRSVVSVSAMALVIRFSLPLFAATDAVAPLAGGLLIVAVLGAITYCSVLWILWNACGCPGGLEDMISSSLVALKLRMVRGAVPEAP
jgi:O-antigen/teichoic acid export membrane protein